MLTGTPDVPLNPVLKEVVVDLPVTGEIHQIPAVVDKEVVDHLSLACRHGFHQDAIKLYNILIQTT